MDAAALEAKCRALIKATGSALSWEREDRFGVMLGVVNGASPALATTIERQLGRKWTADDELAADVEAIAMCLGGFRSGQWLFTTAPGGGALLYCAWWPWGDGAKVSLRVGCHGVGLGPHTLESWFRPVSRI